MVYALPQGIEVGTAGSSIHQKVSEMKLKRGKSGEIVITLTSQQAKAIYDEMAMKKAMGNLASAESSVLECVGLQIAVAVEKHKSTER